MMYNALYTFEIFQMINLNFISGLNVIPYFIFPNSALMSVSYTHLDVYKRQVQIMLNFHFYRTKL